jgi:hypothetical protein
MMPDQITVNRAPVLVLWASVVAERMGFDTAAALTLGKAVAGLTAQSKGRRLGIFKPPEAAIGRLPPKSGLGEDLWIDLCGRPVPARKTSQGIRAVVKSAPIDPAQVRTYLERAFGEDLGFVHQAMQRLARSVTAAELKETAFGLYERFRPAVAPGQKGWGQKGTLDLERIKALAERGGSGGRRFGNAD